MRKRDLTVAPKVLTKQQVENYGREGFISPVRVLSATAAAECRQELEAMEASMGGALHGPIRENRRRRSAPRGECRRSSLYSFTQPDEQFLFIVDRAVCGFDRGLNSDNAF